MTRLDTGLLERRADAHPVELDLKPLQSSVRLEVGAFDQTLDSLSTDSETPRETLDREGRLHLRQPHRSSRLTAAGLGSAGERPGHLTLELLKALTCERRHEANPCTPRARLQLLRRLEVDLVKSDQGWAAGKLGRESLDLSPHCGQIRPRVRCGTVDDVHQHPRALDVTQEPESETRSSRRTLDQAGYVRQHNRPLFHLHHPELRVERGERIGGHLWLRRRERAKKRRLACVGRPDMPDVGDELQVEHHRPLLPLAPWFRIIRRAAGGALEAHVATAAHATAHDLV